MVTWDEGRVFRNGATLTVVIDRGVMVRPYGIGSRLSNIDYDFFAPDPNPSVFTW